MEKASRCGSTNHVYVLCLIDWETKILSPEEMKEFTHKMMQSSSREIDGWTIKSLNWPELADTISSVELGFYHSRLMFKFDLKSTPRNIFQVREVRKKLESKIEHFCLKEVIPHVKSCNAKAKKPYIFAYPIFELNVQEDLWRFRGHKPYSFPTTCFYTELDDPKGKKVRMRVSGAKIISSDMSEWFFNNLVNIIFHEGLYRQTRDKQRGILSSNESLYEGLENRLEDFASKLMTTFHEFSSEFVRRRIAKIGLVASIVIPIIIVVINVVLKLLE